MCYTNINFSFTAPQQVSSSRPTGKLNPFFCSFQSTQARFYRNPAIHIGKYIIDTVQYKEYACSLPRYTTTNNPGNISVILYIDDRAIWIVYYIYRFITFYVWFLVISLYQLMYMVFHDTADIMQYNQIYN